MIDEPCPDCKAEGLESTVRWKEGECTLMGAPVYHDENGHRHHHDPNKMWFEYSCSRGHKGGEVRIYKCWCMLPEGAVPVGEGKWVKKEFL